MASSRELSPGGLRRVAAEQAALRRVAMLVARGVEPDLVFAVVAEEVSALFNTDLAMIARLELDGELTVMAGHGLAHFEPGARFQLDPRLAAIVSAGQTDRASRFDADDPTAGDLPDGIRAEGARSLVEAPILVEGRVWGLIGVGSRRGRLSPDTEQGLAEFTELAAIAITNAQARAELRDHAREQAALRRVATLVARAAAPEEVFAAVAAEAGQVLAADITGVTRYDPDGTGTVLGAWSRTGATVPVSVGTRLGPGERNMTTLVFKTGRPTRIDDYADATGPTAVLAREWGVRSVVGAPVSVGGRLWGAMVVGSMRGPLPAGTEARLAGFTELAATAIASAQARVELREFAEEQAALRRVALLVACGAEPKEVFAAVAAEAGQVLAAEVTAVSRYDRDGTGTIVGSWSRTGAAVPFPVGTRLGPGERNITSLVFQTGRPARIDNYADATGPAAEFAHEWGVRAFVGAPVSVAGRPWGVMGVGSTRGPLPAGTEARLAGFTELVATAVASAQARSELRDYAGEQAALRRVATLVARAAPPEEVFAAVTAEAGRLLGADSTSMSRYCPDGAHTLVGIWTSTGAAMPVSIGTRFGPGGHNAASMVFQTGRPARIDDFSKATGPAAEPSPEMGTRASVAVPITVEDRLWGALSIGSMRGPLPAGTEARLAGFTELAGTAIANAEAQAALTASRARIVATADQTRRRIERDLHDGVQQRLVSLALRLREVQAAPPEAGELAERLEGAVTEATDALEELREIARGLHPTVLAEGGLRPALRALARRSAVPVRLDIQVAGRLPEPVEIAAYYAVSEALTNAVKHARASAAEVEVTAGEGILHVRVRDDGRGGADFGHGSGLIGLRDRMEALGGRISLLSPPGEGTTLHAELPLSNAAGVTS
jgi:GAF domain-containing protein